MTSLPPGRKKTRPIRLVLLLGLTALLFLLILDRYGAATGAGL